MCQGQHFAGNRVNIRGNDGYLTVYYHVLPLAGISVGDSISQDQQIGTLDNSGCQSAPHLHVGRLDATNLPVNFTIPCVNPTPFTSFGDGTIDDDDTDIP
jgi:murein DD-endopeptidase MepM/ murein hydrolase activator NlpD